MIATEGLAARRTASLLRRSRNPSQPYIRQRRIIDHEHHQQSARSCATFVTPNRISTYCSCTAENAAVVPTIYKYSTVFEEVGDSLTFTSSHARSSNFPANQSAERCSIPPPSIHTKPRLSSCSARTSQKITASSINAGYCAAGAR
ncbi:unnamed protein product, partial [Ectocarpus sp. 12 AP-2014]